MESYDIRNGHVMFSTLLRSEQSLKAGAENNRRRYSG